MRRIAIAAASLALVLGLTSCGDEPPRKASTAPSFSAGVCEAITTWGKDIVHVANAFTALSPSLSADGRRAQYLFAFDKQQAVTDELRAEILAAPTTGVDDAEALRTELLRAVDDVVANIHDNKADAATHVDFTTVGPRPDRLFAGTEKSLSLMLKPLDELARDRHVDALGGSCGR